MAASFVKQSVTMTKWQPLNLWFWRNRTNSLEVCFQICWYDLWIGLFFAAPEPVKTTKGYKILRRWYVCLLPCIVIRVSKLSNPTTDEWTLFYDAESR